MTTPIDAEELDWAYECLAAGDTLEDLARASDRPLAEWEAALPDARKRGEVADELGALLDPSSAISRLERRGRVARAGRPTWWTPWDALFEPLFDLASPDWRRPDAVRVTQYPGTRLIDARFQDGATSYHLTTTVRETIEGPCVSRKRLAVSFFIPSGRAHRKAVGA